MKKTLAGLAAAMLLATAATAALADDYNIDLQSTSGIGATASGFGSVAYGAGAQALGDYSIAYGNNNSIAVGNGSVAIGGIAGGYQSTAIRGSAAGDSSVAIGGGAAFATNSISIGYNSLVDATATNSVSIGSESTNTRANSISIGSAGGERQLINVAAGTAATDGVNLGQAQSLISTAISQIDAVTYDMANTMISGVYNHLWDTRNDLMQYTDYKSAQTLAAANLYTNRAVAAALSEAKRYTDRAVATAMAIPTPTINAGDKYAIAINVAASGSEQAIGGAAALRLTPSLSFQAGFSATPAAAKISGCRAGLNWSF